MQIRVNEPPREYTVGLGQPVSMKDCAHVTLDADEQVTFLTPAGGEYDLARKAWGFYATPSINGRLARFGLRTLLVKNRLGQYFVMLVESGSETIFEDYARIEGLTVCGPLDATTLPAIESCLRQPDGDSGSADSDKVQNDRTPDRVPAGHAAEAKR